MGSQLPGSLWYVSTDVFIHHSVLNISCHAIGMITLYVVHAVLIYRLYGLYGSKWVVLGLLVALFSAVSGEIYIILTFAPSFEAVDLGPTFGSVCVADNTRKIALVWYGSYNFYISVC